MEWRGLGLAIWVGLVVAWSWRLSDPESLLGLLFQLMKTQRPWLPAQVLDLAVAFGFGALLAALVDLGNLSWSPTGILTQTVRTILPELESATGRYGSTAGGKEETAGQRSSRRDRVSLGRVLQVLAAVNREAADRTQSGQEGP